MKGSSPQMEAKCMVITSAQTESKLNVDVQHFTFIDLVSFQIGLI